MMTKKTLTIAIGLVVICLIAGFTAWGSLAAKKTDAVVAPPSENSPLQAAIQASNVTNQLASVTPTTQTLGSGKLYKTTVERQTEGELSADDLHQASLLTSQLLMHVNEATLQLADARVDTARSELEKAESLAKVVRGLLPVTVVTTSVKDAQGKEIYRNVQRVQDDQIPISEGDIAVEVVEPIVEAKKDEAALKEVRLADADLIHTSVLVDLSFVERKLKRATELMARTQEAAKPKEAAAELALAQTQAIRFVAHKEDSPLVDVQHALRLAERMVRERKYEGAKANLQLAKIHLGTYRALMDEPSAKPVADLEKEIDTLSTQLQASGTADKIGGMWNRVGTWFTREPGQTQQTSGTTGQKG
jgi:hypothetical protein